MRLPLSASGATPGKIRFPLTTPTTHFEIPHVVVVNMRLDPDQTASRLAVADDIRPESRAVFENISDRIRHCLQSPKYGFEAGSQCFLFRHPA